MEKVKVTKEVAQAIEVLRKNRTDEEILRVLADHNNGWAGEKSKVLNTTPFDLVAKALYIGYEIDKSPEERVADYYDEYCGREARAAVRTVFSILGIKIEGVNA